MRLLTPFDVFVVVPWEVGLKGRAKWTSNNKNRADQSKLYEDYVSANFFIWTRNFKTPSSGQSPSATLEVNEL